jgi:malonate-semialdehyde dehydrogenase (acetylating) / methylmalonate-semialdehyde dehydrogenase
MCGPKEVDFAVQVAEKAYRDWSTTPATKRSAILFRFQQLLEQELESLEDSVRYQYLVRVLR